jgi:hypothetical protein
MLSKVTFPSFDRGKEIRGEETKVFTERYQETGNRHSSEADSK